MEGTARIGNIKERNLGAPVNPTIAGGKTDFGNNSKGVIFRQKKKGAESPRRKSKEARWKEDIGEDQGYHERGNKLFR